MQAYNYFTCQSEMIPYYDWTIYVISAYPKDALRLRILVTVLVLSDAVHLLLVAQLGASPL